MALDPSLDRRLVEAKVVACDYLLFMSSVAGVLK